MSRMIFGFVKECPSPEVRVTLLWGLACAERGAGCLLRECATRRTGPTRGVVVGRGLPRAARSPRPALPQRRLHWHRAASCNSERGKMGAK